jgi:hypothetical protein
VCERERKGEREIKVVKTKNVTQTRNPQLTDQQISANLIQ